MTRELILNPPDLPFSPKVTALSGKVTKLRDDFMEGTRNIDPQFIGTADVARLAKEAGDEYVTRAVGLASALRAVQGEIMGERNRRLAAITTPSKDPAEASYDAATIIALAITTGDSRDVAAYELALFNNDVSYVRSALRAPPTLAIIPPDSRQRLLEETARAIDPNGWARIEQDLGAVDGLLYSLMIFTQQTVDGTLANKLTPADRSALNIRTIGLLVDEENRLRSE